MKKALLENTESQISIALQNAGAKVSEDEIIKYIIDYISDENNLNTDFGGDMASFSIDNDFDGIWVRCEGVVYYHKNVSKGDGYLVPDYNDLEIDGIKNSSLELYGGDGEFIGEWDITGVLNDSITRKKRLDGSRRVKITESELRTIISESIKKVLSEEGIHIKEKNRGKFNATKERTGKSTEELTHSKNPITKKRAIFAQNVKKWNKK